MPNNYLARVLITDNHTPTVAEWAAETCNLLAAALSGEWQRSTSSCYRALVAALENYRLHRAEGDPLRTATHNTLCSKTKEAVNWFYAVVNAGRLDGALPVPSTQEALTAALAPVIAGEDVPNQCHHCGNAYRKRDAGVKWCPNCEVHYVHKCQQCKQVAVKEVLVVNNSLQGLVYYCYEHLPPENRNCDFCGKRAVGPSADGQGVKGRDLEAMGKFLCCHCRGQYKKASCGHIDLNTHSITSVPNVEDDEDTRGEKEYSRKIVCGKCFEQHDQHIQHWNVEANAATAKEGGEVGSTRTFGVELEVCLANKMQKIPDGVKKYWTAKRDGSLPDCGVEFASGILNGERGLKIIKDLCDYAQANKWSVDSSAGFHLHIGVGDLNAKGLAGIALGYAFTQKLWFAFVAKSRCESTYCRPHTAIRWPQGQSGGFFKMEPQRIIDSFTNNEDRYRWVNWQSYRQRNTLEIRLHQGTLVYDKIANWVKAHVRFMDWCSEGERPMGKVYGAMKDLRLNGKEMLAFLGKEVWKDEELAEWFADRAKQLKHGLSVVQGGPTCVYTDPLPTVRRREETAAA